MMKSLNSLFFNSLIKLSYNIFFLFVGVLLTSFSLKQFNSSHDLQVTEKLKITSREKVYLHLDKPYYASGDDIWFKVYLVGAKTNQQTALSKIVYVDLINFENEIIQSREIHIEKGRGYGDFQLDDRLISGQYLIRAYTNYMRNFDQAFFFRKSFQISSLLSTDINNDSVNSETQSIQAQDSSLKPDIQFLPEGGNMVNGFHNRISFKALGENGKGVNVHGTIIDNNGNKVSAFKASNFGLGLFNIIPMQGKSYQALVNYMGQEFYYNLPIALNSGVVMRVRSFQDHFQISLNSSLNNGVKNLTLISLQKGEIVNIAQLKENRKKAIIQVSKSNLNPGIVQFTLLNRDQNPICERLAFFDHQEQSKRATLGFSKDAYKKRELIEIDISLDESIQNSTYSIMSLSVTDLSVINNAPFDFNIKSYLLLISELKGVIESPGYYFIDEDPLRKRNLDFLMLTQGWRKYLFAKKLNDSIEKFKHDQGIIFKGRVKKNSKVEELKQAEVSLVIKENDQILYEKIETDLKGHFDFGYFDIKDSASIVIQVENVKRNDVYKSPRNQYSIKMDSIVELSKPSVSYNLNPKLIAENDDFIERSRSFQSNNFLYKIDKNSELLDEVTVEQVVIKTERELKKEEFDNKMKKSTAIYRDPTQRIDFSELTWTHGTIAEALRGLVFNVSSGPASILGSGGPLVLLNNVPVGADVLGTMPASNIHFVDILKRTKTAIYGSRAALGVIAIYTKDGTEKFFDSLTERKGILNFTHPGSYKAREFYEPKYGSSKPEHKRPDYRTTLIWRPNIQLNEEGKAKIPFYAADIPTTYRIDLQGITSEGIPITSEAYIHVD